MQMANPILNAIFNSSPQMNSIYQIINAYKNGNNPVALLNQLAKNNPQLQPIVQAIQNGANPQQLFYEMCQQKGIDPSSILNKMK